MATRLLIGANRTAPQYEFSRADIKSRSLQVVTAVDVSGSELAADELYADVDYRVGEYIWFSPRDYDGVMTSDGFIFAAADQTEDLRLLPYATPMWLMDADTVLHKLYFDHAERIDLQTYSLAAVSGVGILERRRHLGNLYSGQTVAAVLAEIIGDAFAYTVEPAVASQRVYGLLLSDSARANLHRLLFALGASITQAADGTVQFVFLPATVAGEITTDRVFLGGSVEYTVPVSRVEVTEHAYFQPPTGVEPETIFDNSAQPVANHALVEFDAPYFDLAATPGLTIEESGSTYAILSGSGILSGKPYTHVTRLVARQNADADGGERVVHSDQDQLVNSVNSLGVAERLLAYHTSKETVQLSVKVAGERAGQNVAYSNTFGEPGQGFIVGSQAVITGFERANLKIIKGYVPTGQGNYYSHRILVTASGTVTLPEGVTKIRIVLIQGGHGGQGGYAGQHGLGGNTTYGGDLELITDDENTGFVYANGNQAVPSGGEAGAAGEAGKIYVADLTIIAGASITVSVGAGGAGGAAEGGEGSPGGATTITIGTDTYTSDDGRNSQPYVDLFTGDVMGLAGEEGHAGGAGGQTDIGSLYSTWGLAGYPGGSVGEYSGGAAGEGVIVERRRQPPFEDLTRVIHASGGGGGGAAYGRAGKPGTSGVFQEGEGYGDGLATGGAGGDGADAVAPSTPTYGCGGGGGNGGGGGGNAGGTHIIYRTGFDEVGVEDGGAGGAGSAGGTGGAGVCIIYY